MKYFFLILLSCSVLISKAQSEDEKSIREILVDQTGAWNKGNLEDFMAGYWKSDSLLFIGKNGVSNGWQKTLQNYQKGYPDTTAMGKLNFDLLELRQLSPEYFFVVGKWHLQRSIGNIGGHFSLLFNKINGKWKIVADHSS